jgi:hypothetical protein
MIFRRLELPRRKLMESLSLTRNADIVGSLFLVIIAMNSTSDDTVVKAAVIHYMFILAHYGVALVQQSQRIMLFLFLTFRSFTYNSSHRTLNDSVSLVTISLNLSQFSEAI